MTSDVLETKTPEAVRWSALPERGTLPSLRLLAWIATRIGRWAGRLLLYPITYYFVITAHAARRTSYQYLKQIRGYPAHWWNVFRHFHCFAATILDRLYLLRGEFQRFDLELHGKEVLHDRMESGKAIDRKSTRLNSSHPSISYAVFCLKKKKWETSMTSCWVKPAT